MDKKIFILNAIFSIFLITTNVVLANNFYKKTEGESPLIWGIIVKSILFGIIGSTIICVFIGLKHKNVKKAKNANEYVQKSTINIISANDQLSRYTIKKDPIYKK